MFWIGLATGLFLGSILGFSICALMVISKKADKEMDIII